MIGPGWMPSRPRPSSRARRGLLAYAPYIGRRRRARAESSTGEPEPRAYVSARLFAMGPALPVATLLPHRRDGQQHVLAGALQRWLAERWRWVQPRLIPLLVAGMGLFGVLNARSYLLFLARGGDTATCTMPRGDEVAHCAVAPDLPRALPETVAR